MQFKNLTNRKWNGCHDKRYNKTVMLNTILLLLLIVAIPMIGVAGTKTIEDNMRETRRLSEKGKELIEKHEGKVNKVYICPGGKLTGGIGHALSTRDKQYYKYGSPIHDRTIYAWFDDDVEKSERVVNNWVVREISQSAFDALVSFVFNVGVENFKRSTLLKKLNRGDIKGASEEFGRWVYSKKKKLPGLVARRAEEAQLFRDAETDELATVG